MIVLLSLFARGGGGGSGGGGGGVGIIVLPIIIIAGIIAWWRRRQKIKKAKQNHAIAKANDPTWNNVVENASQIFLNFQRDWSEFNVLSMKNYLAPGYFEHISLMMEALKHMNRQNRMSNVQLISANLFNVNDSIIDTQDNFDIEVRASAYDELIDLTNNSVLFTDDKSFTEIWNFDRENSQWFLNYISQVGEESAIGRGYISNASNKAKVSEASKMKSFAMRNNFFYNADFGWLLLPIRGKLFTLANFGRSDINYHVIGKYRNILVQFYQYIPVVQAKRTFSDYFRAWYKPAYRYDAYTIAQTILPKSYGNIIVKRKSGINLSFKPTGMTHVKLEGVEFNKDYNVYATDIEKVTSLELLNPSYMIKLLSLPFKVNIEIVDNVLYLYSTDKQADFDEMLKLIQDAFQEMRM